jgi:hypothetical protein
LTRQALAGKKMKKYGGSEALPPLIKVRKVKNKLNVSVFLSFIDVGM